MLSKEVTKIVETAILNGKEVKVTVEINNASPATESRLHVNKEPNKVSPPPAPPSRLGRKDLNDDENPFMPRPQPRIINEGGCLFYIIAGVISIWTTIYII